MRNGSRFTDLPGYATMQFYQEVQNRDPRLSGTIRTPGYMREGTTVTLPPDLGATVTGYQLIKFVTDPSHDKINGSLVPLRSEEHTSELQSLMRISYAVFCLKKQNNKHLQYHNIPNSNQTT